MNVTQKIVDLLKEKGVSFRRWEHEPTPTSAIAAKVRNVPLDQGAKAMVLKYDDRFIMCVLQASRKIDYKKMKAVLNTKDLMLATPEEVENVAHCKVGGVPPFGNLFGIPVYLDRGMLAKEIMDFNAGQQTVSMEMKVADYLRVVHPHVTDLSQEQKSLSSSGEEQQ